MGHGIRTGWKGIGARHAIIGAPARPSQLRIARPEPARAARLTLPRDSGNVRPSCVNILSSVQPARHRAPAAPAAAARAAALRHALDDRTQVERLSRTFRALGDPTRSRLVYALSFGELCVSDLATALGASLSATSHQLRILRDLDIVRVRRDGKSQRYTLNEHAFGFCAPRSCRAWQQLDSPSLVAIESPAPRRSPARTAGPATRGPQPHPHPRSLNPACSKPSSSPCAKASRRHSCSPSRSACCASAASSACAGRCSPAPAPRSRSRSARPCSVARITYDQELAEGVAMLVGAALTISLVWWMWLAAPHMKEEIESGMTRATGRGDRRNALGLFVFAFGMVFREGVETAIFLSAAGFNSEGLGLWLGAIAGLALAIGFGVLFMRGTIRVPLKPFFSLTSAVLLLIAIQLLIGGLHELSEAQVLPASRTEMAIIGPLVKNELLLFTLTVALAAGWLLFGPGRKAARPPPAPHGRPRPRGSTAPPSSASARCAACSASSDSSSSACSASRSPAPRRSPAAPRPRRW